LKMDGLPTWMREPLKTDSKEQRMIDCWSLDQQLVEKLGFDNWLPVQLKTIPTILKTEGDVLVSASTGSGKTLCYVLPILNALKNRIVKRTRCLVLVPTKLLVNQVKKQFDDLNLYQLSIVGLGTLSMPQETKLLESGVDIIVATPGRLVDHLQTLELSSLDYLVLDEADRLLAQTYYHIFDKLLLEKQFEPKITEHHQVFPSKTRKLLFSATLTRNPAKLGQLRLFQPVLITNAQDDHRYVVPTTISESYMVVPQPIDKIKALAQYLQEHASPCLVFVKSVQATTRLANVLSKVLNMNVKFLQSDQTPFQRKKIIQGFQEHHIDVIVCSDMSARGIDLTTPLVINYDIPTKTKTYIHRIGRTGRA
ncbi:P-loop containing nucleoside triphosphate hydrolase protein, partial [Gorgonomyces haynaldii]